MSWYKLVGSNGVAIGIERFGASAPYETIYTKLGVTVDKVVEAAHSVIGKTR
jgi:transketolase